MKEGQLISAGTKLLMALALALCASGVAQFAGEDWSRPVSDYFFHLRGPLPPTNDVAIVAIDETSFDELNKQWPWPRSIHASLIDTLFAHGAKTVALDILFSEPSSDPEDNALAEAIKRHPQVILGRDISYSVDPNLGYEQVKIVSPDPILSRLKEAPPELGFVSIAPEADGYLRRLRLEFPDGPAFSWSAARTYLSSIGKTPLFESVSTDFAWINFSGPARTVPTVSYYQALDPDQYLPQDFFKNKLVFVGVSSSSEANLYTPTADHFLVPFSRVNGAYMPGVEVHANAALSILHHRFIRHRTDVFLLFSTILAGFVSALVFLTFRPLESTVLYLILALGVFSGGFYAFRELEQDIGVVYLLIPLTISYLACPFLHYWYTRKQKAFIRKAFSSYISPHLVTELIANPERLELGGKEAEGTVVFLDLAGFTSFSEKLKPRELIDLLNRNLGACADIILRWDGMIDKYIGDCIMAVWGVPIQIEDHAVRACSAMYEVHEEIKRLSANELIVTGVNLSVRVGINSGLLVAGNVGGEKHFNYTVLGNEVNLASRLEGINKFYGTDIVLSESTAKRLNTGFILRELDIIRVVGQQKPTKIYQLWGTEKFPPSDAMVQADKLFQEGRSLYAALRWGDAKRAFEAASAALPDDGPSRKYAARCDEFAAEPPPEGWDGVYQMTSK